MACFVVPAVEAVVTTVAARVIKSAEKEPQTVQVIGEDGAVEAATKIPFSRKLRWLSNLLLDGSVLLAFEHLWHGEIAPWFPFLTAASDPEKASVMLHEMATTGVVMAALCTLVWVGMLVVSSVIEKRAVKEQPAEATK